MRNRTPQPAPLNLPPVEITPIRIYGQLKGPMNQPVQYMTIRLKAITTTQLIVQEIWSEATIDVSGNYDFSVTPGKYAVFLERQNHKERLRNIEVYSDCAPGDLQSFMLSPSQDLLTPVVVLEIKAALHEATAAMLRARQWAENPVDVPVLDFKWVPGRSSPLTTGRTRRKSYWITTSISTGAVNGTLPLLTNTAMRCAGARMQTRPSVRTTAWKITSARRRRMLRREIMPSGH
ncbi:prophage tail fiber N-terminal domain-containing protein [Enterobacter mori]|uniref:prophage tail fiber N-terminal domain-containing protein n=1 Tax=Enterobacter mori TaxID=539813 RepID=UPI003B83E9E8